MRVFSARETEWLQELEGIELAPFSRRAIAFLIDTVLSGFATAVVVGSLTWLFFMARAKLGYAVPQHVNVKLGSEGDQLGKVIEDIVVPVLYWGLLTWQGRGRSPGKRWMKIRVVSLMHRHLSLWHSIERALGYGAAFLEGGFGFFQFFLHPYRRTVQDRIAETIVVTERSYRSMQHKFDHPLIADGEPAAEDVLTDPA